MKYFTFILLRRLSYELEQYHMNWKSNMKKGSWFLTLSFHNRSCYMKQILNKMTTIEENLLNFYIFYL